MPWPPSSRPRPISCPALLVLAGLLLLPAAAPGAPPLTLTLAEPAAAGMSAARLEAIEDLLREAVRDRRLPGAVMLVARQGKMVFWRAVGDRALVPERRPMNLTTIFDVASLTKVVVTTPLVLQYLEEGRVRLEDPLARHLPEFRGHPAGRATIRQLLLHTSGLPPGLPRGDTSEGTAAILRAIRREGLLAPPGTRYLYSDLDYILLGALLERITGRPLPALAHERIFQRLGMRETFFNPPEVWHYRIAPTEILNGEMRAGIVHDPLAFRMGGVAGHAGLFSTAAEVARFGQAWLDALAGRTRWLSSATAERFVARDATPGTERALGWDTPAREGSSLGARQVVFTPLWGEPLLPDLHPYKSAIQLEAEMLVAYLKQIFTDLAYAMGATLYLLPVNRYESHFVNRLEQAASIRRKIKDHAHVRLAASYFQMALEEDDICRTLREYAGDIGYVYIADHNRRLPGQGSADLAAFASVLKEIGYDGWVTLECGAPGANHDHARQFLYELPASLELLRQVGF